MLKLKSYLYRTLYKLSVVLKPVIIKLISPKVRQRLKKGILNQAFPVHTRKFMMSDDWGFNGVNLVGFSRSEMGIGESCRIAAKSMNAGEIPFVILNFKGTNSASMKDKSWIHKEADAPLYNVNLFHINAEQMREVHAEIGSSIFKERYNIGFWHWELPEFPDEWIENFDFVDEVWVPSTFVANSIALKSPVPVLKIPHSIEVLINDTRSRSYFGLPEKPFLFLTMYDLNSFQERKNPQASILAFKKAFLPDNKAVGLVIKVNGMYKDKSELSRLSNLIEDYSNIYIISKTLSRNDTNALISVTDCFISLHRSEGFGLGLAEAMYLGKPAIGTNWSSTTDFMNYQNSCPVNYKLILVGKDHGPYKADQFWAEPDVEHSSEYMYRLVNDKEYYDSIASSGQEYIREFYSPKVIGDLIKKRLSYIKN